jgi:hypothetical protein
MFGFIIAAEAPSVSACPWCVASWPPTGERPTHRTAQKVARASASGFPVQGTADRE